MKRLLVVTLVLAIFFSLSSCGDGWTTENHKELSFSVRGSWNKDEFRTANMANFVQYVSKDNTQVAVQLRVSRDDFFGDGEESLQKIAEGFRDSYLQSYENAKLTRFESSIINDLPAYEIWMTHVGLYDDKKETRIILVEKPDGKYSLVFEGSEEYTGDFAADYDALKDSIK